MPSPRSGESQNDFISRCMGDREARADFPNRDQRLAFCYSQWERRNKLEKSERHIPIKKVDDELQVVYGEVYAPGVPDSQGDFTSAEEVRKMAHRFMAMQRLEKIDEGHDNVETGAYVVESFIAREDDPLYLPESWVVGVHVPDVKVWRRVKNGELNGFSLEALVRAVMKEVEIEVPDMITGRTAKEELDEHDHEFSVQFDEVGNFVGGRTTLVNGHFHEIRKATVTEPAADGHTHRYSFMEQVKIVGVE